MGADNIKSFRSLIDNKSMSVVDWVKDQPKVEDAQVASGDSKFSMAHKDSVAKLKSKPIASSLFRKS